MTQVIEELVVALGLKSSLAADTAAAKGEMSGLSGMVQQHGVAIGAAMAGAGAAILALTDSAKKTNAELSVTATQLGITTEEMRNLALETANVTFPLEEVTATMDLLARAGMEDTDAMKETATALDTLGDATNRSASEVTSALIPALEAFDIPLGQAGDHTDGLTYLMRNSTIEMGDFANVVKYLAPDLDTLGLSMENTEAIMLAMADHGIQGTAATREFRTAVSSADGDVSALYEALGITADEVATYAGEIENADGLTQTFADAANEQYGLMDKLAQKWDEFSLSLGSTLEPLEPLGAALGAGGPMLMGLSSMMTILPTLSTVSIPTLSGALTFLAANPIILVIAAVAAIVLVLWQLEERFGFVSAAIDVVTGAVSGLIDWFSSMITSMGETEGESAGFGDALLLLLGPIGAVIFAFAHWDEILDIVTGIFDTVMGYVDDCITWLGDAGTRLMEAIVDGILNGPSPLNTVLDMLGLGSLGTILGGDSAAAPVPTTQAAGSATANDYSVVINNPVVTSGDDIDALSRQIDDQQRQQMVRAGYA